MESGGLPAVGGLEAESGLLERGTDDLEQMEPVFTESALAGERQMIGAVDEGPVAVRGSGVEAHDGGADGIGADGVGAGDEEARSGDSDL